MISRAKPQLLIMLIVVLALLPLGVARATNSGTWTSVASMANAREQHTATVLVGTYVLAAGGVTCNTSPCSVLSSAELYSAISNKWTATGSLHAARAGQTMTLFTTGPLSGTVLVTGGCASIGDGAHCESILSSAEVYVPKTGTWTAVGSMLTPRFGHTATQLKNGEVLIAGGYNSANPAGLASAELFNPATRTFTTTGSMSEARDLHTATLLNNGAVMVAGGCCTNGGSSSSVELYNYITGRWQPAHNMLTSRYYHTSTLLKNGEVLVTGGLSGCVDYVCAPTNSAEVFNPATTLWTAVGSMSTPRYLQTATLLPLGAMAGQVLVAGGASAYGSSPLASAELFNSATNTFTTTGSLSAARVSHTATLLINGAVLVTGGYNFATTPPNTLQSAELYNP